MAKIIPPGNCSRTTTCSGLGVGSDKKGREFACAAAFPTAAIPQKP
jgi:hypothetical protein